MNGPGDLARILKRELVREPPTNAGFFQVSGVRPGDHLVSLRGGGFVEPMPVGRTNWCRAFADAVDAGVADGRSVFVYFVSGQPVIVDVMG
ncbi:hypothetical protein [Nakamurella sp.]|uniref:hypothetical protein n=1 Tax=Nakamurella sp. TaxID=1869182 RepID=UPI003B3BD3B1